MREELEAGVATVFPWSDSMYRTGQADPTGAEPPTLEILSDEHASGGRTVILQLRSPRGADKIDLLVPRAQLASISVEGQALPVDPGDSGPEHYYLWCFGHSCDGLQARLEFASPEPVSVFVVDYSLGLPTTAARLIQARPVTAVSYCEGDLTVIWRRRVLQPNALDLE